MTDILLNISGFLAALLLLLFIIAVYIGLVVLGLVEYVGYKKDKKAEEDAEKPDENAFYYKPLGENYDD